MLIKFVLFLLIVTPAIASEMKILAWNTFMLPKPIKFSNQHERTKIIGKYLQNEDHDFIFMEEAFTGDFRSHVGKAVKDRYPHQYYLARKIALKVFGSGVFVMSKHPFKVLDKVYYKECGSADCFARKGSVLIESTLPSGKVVQIAATHLQAIEKLGDVRMSQLHQVKGMLDKHKREGVPQFLIGDLNIDAPEVEFAKGLELMNMMPTELTGDYTHTNVIPCYKKEEATEEWIDHMWVSKDSDLRDFSMRAREFAYDNKGTKCNASDHLAIEGVFTFADN